MTLILNNGQLVSILLEKEELCLPIRLQEHGKDCT